MREYGNSISPITNNSSITSQAHLIVPGHDRLETTHFFPPSSRSDTSNNKRWHASSPLHDITPYPTATPRSQIPHFPDDPKSRFLDELDEEIPDGPIKSSQITTHDSPSKRGKGQWRSVKSLDQFWELMAYRQECSSGRLVGFLWMIFTPDTLVEGDQNDGLMTPISPSRSRDHSHINLQAASLSPDKHKIQSTAKPETKKKKKQLTGPVIARAPRVKGLGSSTDGLKKSTTKYYHSPPHTRGTVILNQKSYDRVHEILLRLDFANLDIAATSTHKWIEETAVVAGKVERNWGVHVEGSMAVLNGAVEDASGGDKAAAVPTMLMGKKKQKPSVDGSEQQAKNAAAFAANDMAPTVNTLPSSLVRKKRPAADMVMVDPVPAVKMLDAGLVRKKAKAS